MLTPTQLMHGGPFSPAEPVVATCAIAMVGVLHVTATAPAATPARSACRRLIVAIAFTVPEPVVAALPRRREFHYVERGRWSSAPITGRRASPTTPAQQWPAACRLRRSAPIGKVDPAGRPPD